MHGAGTHLLIAGEGPWEFQLSRAMGVGQGAGPHPGDLSLMGETCS